MRERQRRERWRGGGVEKRKCNGEEDVRTCMIDRENNGTARSREGERRVMEGGAER